MPGLINVERSSTRKFYFDENAPARILCRTALDAAFLHICDKRVDVIAQEVKLVPRIAVGLMDRSFGFRQAKDDVPAAGSYG